MAGIRKANSGRSLSLHRHRRPTTLLLLAMAWDCTRSVLSSQYVLRFSGENCGGSVPLDAVGELWRNPWAFHQVDFFDLGLASSRVLCQSEIGEPTHRRWFYGMPRIHPQLPDCVVLGSFSGETLERERSRARSCDEAFLVWAASGSSQPQSQYLYAVTNWHVAIRLGASIIRLNTNWTAETQLLEYDPADWVF